MPIFEYRCADCDATFELLAGEDLLSLWFHDERVAAISATKDKR